MGANPKYNVVNNVVLRGGPGPGELDGDEKTRVKDEMAVYDPSAYSNIQQPWYDMIYPENISLNEYNDSLVSKQGNTLMNYPFAAPSMKTYFGDETVKYVLSNAGAKAYGNRDSLNTRYLAEGRTRMLIFFCIIGNLSLIVKINILCFFGRSLPNLLSKRVIRNVFKGT